MAQMHWVVVLRIRCSRRWSLVGRAVSISELSRMGRFRMHKQGHVTAAHHAVWLLSSSSVQVIYCPSQCFRNIRSATTSWRSLNKMIILQSSRRNSLMVVVCFEDLLVTSDVVAV